MGADQSCVHTSDRAGVGVSSSEQAEERAVKAEQRASKAEESVRSLKKRRSSLSSDGDSEGDKGVRVPASLNSVKSELKSLIPRITKSNPVAKKSSSQFRSDPAKKPPPSSSSPPKRQRVTRLFNVSSS